MRNPNKLLSRKEAADYLGLKENTLAVWAVRKKDSLPFIKIGGGKHNSGTVRYRQSDLDSFLENNTICYKKNQKAINPIKMTIVENGLSMDNIEIKQ